MAVISGFKKLSGKKRGWLIVAFILCVLLIYSGIDQIIFIVQKPAIESLTRNYLAGVEKINTYGADCSSLSTDALAQKKTAQMKALLDKYFVSGYDNGWYTKTMNSKVLNMNQKKAKIISFSISSVRIKSMEKLPWKFDYDVKVIYKVTCRFIKEADCFEGSAFTDMSGGKRLGGSVMESTWYCLMTLQAKKSGVSMKIADISMAQADSMAELEQSQSEKTQESSVGPWS